ncbi:hypothetical protein L596_005114 [Steinernema carpocapsae]|uniref:Uncharacterized protein n=1 Tax=Steinernema carpocapsae TaxID=34508 RepID=A0A4U8UZG4_STECR|nr:hypothetical protein L596_005114 [Steinernema carpocapsae]
MPSPTLAPVFARSSSASLPLKYPRPTDRRTSGGCTDIGEMFNVLFSLAKESSTVGTPVASPGCSSRDNLVKTVCLQHRSRQKLLDPYRRVKNALKNMQDDYLLSREKNVFLRYMRMQHMICEVIILEKQYWQLLDIPMQEISETPNDYVIRIMQMLDERSGQPVKVGGIASLLGTTVSMAEKTKDQNLYSAVKAKTTDELRKECDRLYIELYKLLKKYLGLRKEVQELSRAYHESRFYPIVPRYIMLKSMIKRVLRAPAFAEICHEVNE